MPAPTFRARSIGYPAGSRVQHDSQQEFPRPGIPQGSNAARADADRVAGAAKVPRKVSPVARKADSSCRVQAPTRIRTDVPYRSKLTLFPDLDSIPRAECNPYFPLDISHIGEIGCANSLRKGDYYTLGGAYIRVCPYIWLVLTACVAVSVVRNCLSNQPRSSNPVAQPCSKLAHLRLPRVLAVHRVTDAAMPGERAESEPGSRFGMVHGHGKPQRRRIARQSAETFV